MAIRWPFPIPKLVLWHVQAKPLTRWEDSRMFFPFFLFCCVFSSAPTASANGKIDESKMEYIDNGIIKLGVNLALGGSITYIADSRTGKNVVNN